jgi:hypothetical protein
VPGVNCIALRIEFLDLYSSLNTNNNPWRYSSDEPWPAEQPPLAVFPDCTRR